VVVALVVALLVLLAEAWIAGTGPEQLLRAGLGAATRRSAVGQLGIRIAASCSSSPPSPASWLGREPAEEVVAVMGDHSARMSPMPTAIACCARSEANAAGGGRGGLVTVGAATRVATDLGERVRAAVGGTPGQLEDAVLLAAAMVPGEHDGRIVWPPTATRPTARSPRRSRRSRPAA
jgi:hypothetical protein